MMPNILQAFTRPPMMLALATALSLSAAPAQGADPADQSWPCIQRKTPEISPVQIWAGPPLDAVGNSWRDDPTVAELARRLAERRTSLDDAKTLIADFAEAAGADKQRSLTALAAGVLKLINADRGSIMAGIERYAKRQQDLAAKIERQTAELRTLPADGTAAEESQHADLREIQDWDIRIFHEREQSLTYVCELPVQLESRAFDLAREMQKHLDP